jgi:hypothetical protein
MKRFDLTLGAALVLLGIYLIVTGLGFGYQTGFSPGPGFIPFWLGVILIVLGTVLSGEVIVGQIRLRKAAISQGDANPSDEAAEQKDRQGQGIFKIMLLLCGLLVVNLLIEWLGFIVSTCLMALTMMMVMDRRRWRLNVCITICTGVILHFGFRVFFELTMPTGLLPF